MKEKGIKIKLIAKDGFEKEMLVRELVPIIYLPPKLGLVNVYLTEEAYSSPPENRRFIIKDRESKTYYED